MTMVDPKGKKGPEPKRVLGRGLDALLPAVTAGAAAKVDQEFQRVPIEQLRPQKGQPRRHFDESSLDELAESIKTQGVIQPIIVRTAQQDGEFEIVAGERRWRAAQRAGLHEVPVVIKEVAPSAAFELALVENVQRTDLDAIETAEAYQHLMDDHGYTQETLAARVGKSRATVANTLRLLSLPGEIRQNVVTGSLSEGHARALLSLRDEAEMLRVSREAIEKKWSVRQTESAARRTPREGSGTKKPSEGSSEPKSPNVRSVEQQLAAALGMSVVVREDPSKTSGVVEIGFDSLDQLDRFLNRVLGE